MAQEKPDIPIGEGTVGCTSKLEYWPVTLKGSANQKVVFIDTKGFGSYLTDKEEIESII